MNAASLPLASARVLVTRPSNQASDFARGLEGLGAAVSFLAVIAIEPPEDWSDADRRLERLADFDWLVFASANGVEQFFARLAHLHRALPATVSLAAVGPATAAALARHGRPADLIPAIHDAEHLIDELARQGGTKRVLFVHGEPSRLLQPALQSILLADHVIVYRQREVIDRADPALRLLAAGQLDFVTLTSPNIARTFLNALDEQAQNRIRSGAVRLVSISPLTSGAVRELGYPVAIEAQEYTTGGMIAALVQSKSRSAFQER